MTLRRPPDQLADCVSLPRFVAKVRPPAPCGHVPADYRRAFGHAPATDGAFLAHVQLTLAAALAAIAEPPSDETVTRWFRGPPGVNSATLADWNTRAPRFDQPGQPGGQPLRFALKTLSARCAAPRVPRAFTAIAWDEGYLDALVPPALGSTADYSLRSR